MEDYSDENSVDSLLRLEKTIVKRKTKFSE